MNIFDIKKTHPTPKDKWEAINLLIKTQSKFMQALFIMQSTIDNLDDSECLEINKRRINDFLSQYK